MAEETTEPHRGLSGRGPVGGGAQSDHTLVEPLPRVVRGVGDDSPAGERPTIGGLQVARRGRQNSDPVDADDLSIGSRFHFADGFEAVRSRLQRLVDIRWAMRQGQEHIVLGVKERAVA